MPDFSSLRYEGETELVRILEEDFALANYYDIFDNKDDLEEITNHLLSNSVKLNRVVAPRLYRLCEEISTQLSFSEEVDFYLFASPEVNAFSINGFNIVPHMICFTSSLVNLLSDDELRFVIGHEIGHIIYKHSQLDVVNKLLGNREDEEIPAIIAIHFLRWQRYAEVSADRIGYLAVPDVKTIGRVFFKFAAGLSEEHLNFDVDEFLKQLEQIKEIAKGDPYSTHPNNLIRIRNLELFANSQLYPGQEDSGVIPIEQMQKDIAELMNLLEIHPKKEKDRKAVEFIASVGSYLAYADGDMAEREWKMLYEWLADYTTQPEQYLDFSDLETIGKQVESICSFYANRHDGSKFQLFERLVALALLDGRLEKNEKERLYEIGGYLAISEEEITQTIRHSSEQYLTPSKKILIKKLR